MKWLFVSLIATSCSMAQNKNLTDLRDELDAAKETLSTAHARVSQLEEEIAKREISKIRYEIEKIRESPKRNLTKEEYLAFFSKQREILDQIIKSHLSCSPDAKILLNMILTHITKLDDTATE